MRSSTKTNRRAALKPCRRYWIVRSTCLFATAVRGARHRREVIVAGALENLRVKADALADVLDDDALQIVVQDAAGDPAERFER